VLPWQDQPSIAFIKKILLLYKTLLWFYKGRNLSLAPMYLVRMPLVFIFASTYLNLDLFSISCEAYESCLNILHCYKNEGFDIMYKGIVHIGL